MKERILIKLSGEALMGDSGYGIDVSTINFISKEIKKIAKLNFEICLIIGGGNIFRGVKGASEGIDRLLNHILKEKLLDIWKRIELLFLQQVLEILFFQQIPRLH